MNQTFPLGGGGECFYADILCLPFIHISDPTSQAETPHAVFPLKKKTL